MALAVAHKHLVAKFETPCATCNAPILQGESMFPASDSVHGYSRYHHLDCALRGTGSMEALLASAPVCMDGALWSSSNLTCCICAQRYDESP